MIGSFQYLTESATNGDMGTWRDSRHTRNEKVTRLAKGSFGFAILWAPDIPVRVQMVWAGQTEIIKRKCLFSISPFVKFGPIKDRIQFKLSRALLYVSTYLVYLLPSRARILCLLVDLVCSTSAMDLDNCDNNTEIEELILIGIISGYIDKHITEIHVEY